MMRIKEATSKDDILSLLKHVIPNGWPQTVKGLPKEVKYYWNFHEQMKIENELILKNTKVVIPETATRNGPKFEDGQLGVQKCISQARWVIYWPDIVIYIETAARSCEACVRYSRANSKKRPTNSSDLLLGPEIPIHLWTKLGTDLFQYNNINYLLIVDYTLSLPVIWKVASFYILSCHLPMQNYIPQILHTTWVNLRQWSLLCISRICTIFQKYNFKHTTT